MAARHSTLGRPWWWPWRPKPPAQPYPYPLVETWEACRTNYRR
jgi:hypothetical protein